MRALQAFSYFFKRKGDRAAWRFFFSFLSKKKKILRAPGTLGIENSVKTLQALQALGPASHPPYPGHVGHAHHEPLVSICTRGRTPRASACLPAPTRTARRASWGPWGELVCVGCLPNAKGSPLRFPVVCCGCRDIARPRAARAPLHRHAGSAGRAQLVRLPHVYRQHVPSARTCGCRARRPRSATRGLSRGPPYHSQHLRGPRVGPRGARGASLTCPLWSSSCLTCPTWARKSATAGPTRRPRARGWSPRTHPACPHHEDRA